MRREDEELAIRRYSPLHHYHVRPRVATNVILLTVKTRLGSSPASPVMGDSKSVVPLLPTHRRGWANWARAKGGYPCENGLGEIEMSGGTRDCVLRRKVCTKRYIFLAYPVYYYIVYCSETYSGAR